jgi:hypothetical protein
MRFRLSLSIKNLSFIQTKPSMVTNSFKNKIKSDSNNDFHEMSYQVLLNNTLRDNINASLSFRFKILIEKEKER